MGSQLQARPVDVRKALGSLATRFTRLLLAYRGSFALGLGGRADLDGRRVPALGSYAGWTDEDPWLTGSAALIANLADQIDGTEDRRFLPIAASELAIATQQERGLSYTAAVAGLLVAQPDLTLIVSLELADTDLSGLSFVRANLTGANLRRARLIDTNLREALLIRADLTQARLTRADLSEVVAIKASFRQADLTEVRFVNADLTTADLSGALVSGADFRDARIDQRFDVTGFMVRRIRQDDQTATGVTDEEPGGDEPGHAESVGEVPVSPADDANSVRAALTRCVLDADRDASALPDELDADHAAYLCGQALGEGFASFEDVSAHIGMWPEPRGMVVAVADGWHEAVVVRPRQGAALGGFVLVDPRSGEEADSQLVAALESGERYHFIDSSHVAAVGFAPSLATGAYFGRASLVTESNHSEPDTNRFLIYLTRASATTPGLRSEYTLAPASRTVDLPADPPLNADPSVPATGPTYHLMNGRAVLVTSKPSHREPAEWVTLATGMTPAPRTRVVRGAVRGVAELIAAQLGEILDPAVALTQLAAADVVLSLTDADGNALGVAFGSQASAQSDTPAVIGWLMCPDQPGVGERDYLLGCLSIAINARAAELGLAQSGPLGPGSTTSGPGLGTSNQVAPDSAGPDGRNGLAAHDGLARLFFQSWTRDIDGHRVLEISRDRMIAVTERYPGWNLVDVCQALSSYGASLSDSAAVCEVVWMGTGHADFWEPTVLDNLNPWRLAGLTLAVLTRFDAESGPELELTGEVADALLSGWRNSYAALDQALRRLARLAPRFQVLLSGEFPVQ
ncbi:MAG: pentapeptide repeat-containing protein, partial [Nocardioides sp.]